MRASFMIAAAMTALLTAATARAADIPPPAPVIDGHKVEVSGIHPGMSPSEVRAIAAKLGLKETRVNESQLSAGTVRVWKSPAFVLSLIFTKDAATPREEIEANFTGPGSGNQLIAVRRTLTWHHITDILQAPDVVDMHNFTMSGFGKFSHFYMDIGKTWNTYWWRFKDGKLSDCQSFVGGREIQCGDSVSYGYAYDMRPNDQPNVDVLMRIKMEVARGRVIQMEHIVDDFRRRDLAAQADAAYISENAGRVQSEALKKAKPSENPF